jgi:hypothetical protein
VRGVTTFLVLAAVMATGCSSSSHDASVSPTTTSTSSPLSHTQLDRQLCAAYEAFWNSPYSGGEPGPAMMARERALVTAAEAAFDRALHDKVRAVIEAELGLPSFYLHDTASQFRKNASSLPADAKAALAAVEQNDRSVRSACKAAGRPITG